MNGIHRPIALTATFVQKCWICPLKCPLRQQPECWEIKMKEKEWNRKNWIWKIRKRSELIYSLSAARTLALCTHRCDATFLSVCKLHKGGSFFLFALSRPILKNSADTQREYKQAVGQTGGQTQRHTHSGVQRSTHSQQSAPFSPEGV